MGRHNKRWQEVAFSLVERTARRSSYLGRSMEIAGNVASFALWQRQRGLEAPSFATREALWTSVVFPRLRPGVTVLEFGVADGDATRFWLSRLQDPTLTWHGFDVFTGLPVAWSRGGVEMSPAGRFDVGGRPPAIQDERVRWHVGLVEETLPSLEPPTEGQICALVDLDLYEPSKAALDWFAAHARPGDLLYFDELYDPWHERRALDALLDAGHRLSPLGSTGMAAAFEHPGPGERI